MEYDIRDLQKTVMLIAKEVDRLCKQNNIQYTMIAGTLLGAIRHKGFIPWDDDMDFVLLRKDYDRFREVCVTGGLGKGFELVDWHTNSNYKNPFIKICLKNTRVVEEEWKDALFEEKIFVDIFPIDQMPNGYFQRQRQRLVTKFCIRTLQHQAGCKFKFRSWKSIFSFMLRILSKIIKHNTLVTLCEKEMRRYEMLDTENVVALAGRYDYYHHSYNKEWFENYIDLPFEDMRFQSIEKYDDYLTHLYGDYMTLPPIEKRVGHKFCYIDFGDWLEK